MVLFGFNGEVAREHAKLVAEAFGEIGGAVEPDDIGDLADLVFTAAQQFSSLLEPYELDIIVGCHPRDRFDLLVQTGPTQCHIVRQCLDQVARLGEVVHDDLVDLGEKLDVAGVVRDALWRNEGGGGEDLLQLGAVLDDAGHLRF